MEVIKTGKNNILKGYDGLKESQYKLLDSIGVDKSIVESFKETDEAFRQAIGDWGLYKYRQQRIFNNKVAHGFNTTNVYQEARYIIEEVAELMRAIEKKDNDNLKEELADIIIFAYGCASVAGINDIDAEVFKKMEINEKRQYTKTDDGDFIKS